MRLETHLHQPNVQNSTKQGFSKGADAATLTKYRESELKHGRVAMLAVLGWLTQERFHPFYDGKLSSNPLKAFLETPPAGFVQIVAFCGLLEYAFQSAAKSPNYKAGDYYGFNQLFQDPESPEWVDFQTRELNNGESLPCECECVCVCVCVKRRKSLCTFFFINTTHTRTHAQNSKRILLLRQTTKHTQIGRLAMFGIMGEIAHTAITGKGAIELFFEAHNIKL